MSNKGPNLVGPNQILATGNTITQSNGTITISGPGTFTAIGGGGGGSSTSGGAGSGAIGISNATNIINWSEPIPDNSISISAKTIIFDNPSEPYKEDYKEKICDCCKEKFNYREILLIYKNKLSRFICKTCLFMTFDKAFGIHKNRVKNEEVLYGKVAV